MADLNTTEIRTELMKRDGIPEDFRMAIMILCDEVDASRESEWLRYGQMMEEETRNGE